MSESSQARSLPWHRVDNDFVDHPKTFALEELLGDKNAGMYVARLWSYTMRYAARGRHAPGAETALERALRWDGERGQLVAALLDTGWLARDADGGLEVHDWAEHQGAAVAKAEKDAERKRNTRQRRGDGAETARRRRGDGAETARVTEQRRNRDRDVEKKDAGSATPDPRHRPLIGTLTAAFAELRGSKYPFQQRDAKTVQRLLALAEPVAIDAAWRRALKHQGYPTVSTLQELEKHLARFLGTGPPATQRGPADVPLWTNDDAGEIHP